MSETHNAIDEAMNAIKEEILTDLAEDVLSLKNNNDNTHDINE